MTTPCPNVGNFQFACVNNPKMRWILVGKQNLPQCPRPTRDASDCSCCNCFCQPPGWQKKCCEHWLKKCFIVLGYMQRRRCSLTLCKAMYKTHGASTEYHHVCILSPGCFAIPTWENIKKPRKHPLFKKNNWSFRGKILPFPKNLPQNLGGFHQWRCPRLQVLPPPWHQVIGNSESTRGKSPWINGSGQWSQGWCFFSVNFNSITAIHRPQKNRWKQKKHGIICSSNF